MAKSDGSQNDFLSPKDGNDSSRSSEEQPSRQAAVSFDGQPPSPPVDRVTSPQNPTDATGKVEPADPPGDADNTDWGYLNLTQTEPESIPHALARTVSSMQLAGRNTDVASVGALTQLVEHLNHERIKVQELMSSLSFALRSFNNVNQILELIPLVSSRIADASGAALVLFEQTGNIKISRMYCSEGGDCSHIKRALEVAVESVSSELANSSGKTSGNTSSSPTGSTSSTSIELADSFEHLLDEQVGLSLGRDVQLFGTSLLSRSVIRGRLYVFSHNPNYVWNAERQKLIRLVADQTAVAIENDSLNSELRYRARIAQEIAIGSEIQQRLQPQRCPTIAGLDIAARSQSASPVGGDYYDFIQVPLSSASERLPPERRPQHRWGIAIGDVMGKGVPAGLLMMATRGVLRAEVLHNREPAQILQHLNRVTYNDMENSRRFVSLFYSDYCPCTRLLRYSNAAHNPCLWWKAETGNVSFLDTDGMLIGVDADSKYEQKQVQLNVGDVVLYYTDGITEAVNPRGDRFEEDGLTCALQTSAASCQHADGILESLFEQVRDF